MTISLRPYQRDAINSVYQHWEQGGGHGLLNIATGLGKSIIIATICQELLERWPNLRLLMVVHNRELVSQNTQELLRVWPSATVGINSASLGRRDTRSQILFATIQSVYKHAEALGPRDLVIGDECHMWPKTGDGMYRTLLAGLLAMVPDLRVLGTSATCFRLDSGLLHKGKDALFEKVIYDYGIGEGVRDGWLAPLISRPTTTKIDTSDVHIRGGEYIASELESASMACVREAVAELVEKGQDRRAWLAFCAGVKHAEAVRDAIRSHNISCEMVTGQTPAGERERIISDFRAGEIRCLTNVNVLTTGFNVPQIDMLALLRATLSTGLFVQMCGRATRQAPGKTNALVLDFAGLVRNHGPVDTIVIAARKEAEKVKPDDVRAKECPGCGALILVQCKTCPHCNFKYIEPEKPKHAARADENAPIMATLIPPPQWVQVQRVDYARHQKEGAPDSLRVTYYCGLLSYREWVPLENEKGRRIAAAWWFKMAADGPARWNVPLTVGHALTRLSELRQPAEIQVELDGKFWRITGHRLPRREVAA